MNISFRPLAVRTAATALALFALSAHAEPFSMGWKASTTANVGTGDFAPSLIMANRAGTITQSMGVYERASIFKTLEPEKRFSYAFCWLSPRSTIVAGSRSRITLR